MRTENKRLFRYSVANINFGGVVETTTEGLDVEIKHSFRNVVARYKDKQRKGSITFFRKHHE